MRISQLRTGRSWTRSRQAIEALGEDTLMFATDYPHSASWFPKSVGAFRQWQTIPETAKRKLLWDNPASSSRRYSAKSVTQ